MPVRKRTQVALRSAGCALLIATCASPAIRRRETRNLADAGVVPAPLPGRLTEAHSPLAGLSAWAWERSAGAAFRRSADLIVIVADRRCPGALRYNLSSLSRIRWCASWSGNCKQRSNISANSLSVLDETAHSWSPSTAKRLWSSSRPRSTGGSGAVARVWSSSFGRRRILTCSISVARRITAATSSCELSARHERRL